MARIKYWNGSAWVYADSGISPDGNKEDKSNKVTSISSSSTDVQYPSAKAVQTFVNNQGYLTKGFYVGTSAPSNTNLLWIDTTATTGGLKYYNGSAWVAVPVLFS